MEKLLHKLARQLDSLDEASLSALWSKYATLTSRFEPTRRWEDACLIFSMIQAKKWKNQLFNYCWGKQRQPVMKEDDSDLLFDTNFDITEMYDLEDAPGNKNPAKVLQFKPLTDKQDNNDPNKSED